MDGAAGLRITGARRPVHRRRLGCVPDCPH
nr:MAG TPA: hypothetical protein [Caudoviricetes sp.]